MVVQNEVYSVHALRRIAKALERIADTLQSLDEPQTFEMEQTPFGVTQIREVKD